MFPPGRARNDTGGDGITDHRHDNGNRSRSLFRGENGRRTGRHNDIDLGLNRLSDEPREPIILTLRPAVFDHDIPPLDVVEIAQALAKGGDEFGLERGRRIAKVRDPPHLPRLLPLGSERRGEEATSQGAEERTSVRSGPPSGRA